MTTWEYWWGSESTGERGQGLPEVLDMLMDAVSAKGVDGWELVNHAITRVEAPTNIYWVTCVMKRPLE